MTAELEDARVMPMPAASGSRLHRARMGFRGWRRSRPFWGGLMAIIGGLLIMAGPALALKVILVAGQTVWIGILVGVLIWVLGLFLWFAPSQASLAGVLIVILACASFISSDLGGFLIGMLLAIIGGAKGFAWVPDKSRFKKPKRSKAEAEDPGIESAAFLSTRLGNP